jgi:tetratricopeptide (TPR) repeat protein
MSLQLLENKALSRGIIGKSAPILAEITIRKSQFSDYYLSLAVLYLYEGNIEKSRNAYSKAIKICPLSIKVYFYFCLALLGEGSFKKVIGAKETLMTMFRRFGYPLKPGQGSVGHVP